MTDTWILKAGMRLYPGAVWKLNTARKEIALTFDDGPEPEITPKVLAILAQYARQATFFCVGNKAVKYPSLVQQIREQGHAVGNHSYSHCNGFFTSPKTYVKDVEKAQAILQSSLFRPPYGRITPSQYKILSENYRIVFWNVISYDFHPRFTAEKCLNHCLQNLQNGAVFVFHDTRMASRNLLTFLPEFLDTITSMGFDTVTLTNPVK